jgi:hypothetical protein
MAYAIDPNLVAYWAFDETSGTTAHDSAGTHDGTVSGAQWTSDGKFGNALNFNGSAYVNIGDLGLNGDWTVCFWAKSNNNSDIIYYPIGLGSPDKGIFMGGTHIQVRQHAGLYDGNFLLKTETSVQTGVWYHLAVVKNGPTYSIYVNGVCEKTGGLSDIDLTNFKIGARPDRFAYFKGIIDDVGVWNHAMALGNIEDPESGTINYARINGVSGPGYGVAWNPRPANEQTGAPNNITLMWRPGECATEVDEHRVYFGTNFNGVNQDTVPCVHLTEPNYSPGILDSNTTYYWRVDEVMDSNIYRGPVWRFTVRPNSASEPYPLNNAKQVSESVKLSWIPGSYVADMNGHDVYFGTDFDKVKEGYSTLVSDMSGDGQVNLLDLSLFSQQ